MLDFLKRVKQIPELQARIVFTLVMILIYRIGGFIPVPGINGEVALSYFRHAAGGGQNLFQLVDIFSGGAFSQMTVVALGVVPYISSSIIMQLVVALMPSLQREIKENPDFGKRKLARWTRFFTIGLSFLQAGLFSKYAMQINASHPGVIYPLILDVTLFNIPWLFYLIVIMTMTAGTMLLMWVGEQITERGVGNGMSLIISVGILSQLPSTIGILVQQLNLDSPQAGQLSLATLLVMFVLFIAVIIATIWIIQGQRKIPLQHARRIVGRKEVQGGHSYIPLKVNYAGVVPVIFASSLLMFPATLAQFIGTGNWLGQAAHWLSPGTTPYLTAYVLLIVFFSYFWTATQFRPDQVASDMKKNGAFIPGIRQGKHTQDYLESSMSRITLIGALLLALIAILPNIIGKFLSIPQAVSYFFGGTALLILVGVILDTMKQIDSHLLMRRYDGLIKRAKPKSRL